MEEFNSFMRASQIKMSQTPKKNKESRPSDADAMMADIQAGCQFFNDEQSNNARESIEVHK